ncbi:MAG: nicotinate-nucleotide adenylyltransferase [Muribaculaceae bacterium]|nr:nicotinate-nucleotide adenylyltransferase [Muribaculaceae bacterium]
MKPHKRRIGIMGGSFNPIHEAHLMIADYIAQRAALDEVWLMVSPMNPLKVDSQDLAADNDRFLMAEIACRRSRRLRASRFEFDLPRPSYTVDTLAALREAYPDCEFTLIIGSDNWAIFDKWRQADEIKKHHRIVVYPRPGYTVNPATLPQGVYLIEAPELDLSSTFIRNAMAKGIDMNYFLPSGVYDYIKSQGLYKKQQ